MKKILQIGSAFIGIIVGAGFASGQEVLQYFTSFGLIGTVGAAVAAILFAYLGMTLTRLGSRLQTTSHKEAVYKISGHHLGKIVDAVIIFTLFGVGMVMLAGAGSIVSQQFGLPSFIGISVMTFLVLLAVMFNIDRVVGIIGSLTPFLILAVIIVSVYSFSAMDGSFAALDPIAKEQPTALPNWIVSAINYVSFNIAVGAAMALVMGGTERDERTAALGGLVGGLGIGVLIILSHLAIFSKIGTVASFEMPMLEIVDRISPVLGSVYALILCGMIFNTAVSMFYAFGARFTKIGTGKFKRFIAAALAVAFFASFAGFTKLVAFFYPLIGYLGLFLIAALIYASIQLPSGARGKLSA
ncbi:YkvI family membrane protein [Planococcus lenghuensis]|uniref:Membrane protein YkvI n=1 Tax=Planococcus lenghuensis TaxID=2213202 RepID=A0A1Q2L2F2_9BACL|nr:hypothetical protein [Planococcus lenghuensis]AQQ54638.1 hypothetical protein B0X71_17025 [Planococcus lenghuensis]